MKKLFKGILASLLALTLVIGLGACSKKSETKDETTQAQTTETTVAQTEAPAQVSYAGTWKLTSAEAGGIVVNDFSQLSQMTGQNMDMSIELKEDGTASMTYNGETKGGAKWQEEDGQIKLLNSSGGDGEMAFTKDGEKLYIEQEASGMTMKLFFTKQ